MDWNQAQKHAAVVTRASAMENAANCTCRSSPAQRSQCSIPENSRGNAHQARKPANRRTQSHRSPRTFSISEREPKRHHRPSRQAETDIPRVPGQQHSINRQIWLPKTGRPSSRHRLTARYSMRDPHMVRGYTPLPMLLSQ